MVSIFQQVMGPEFDRLHPMMQRRFGVGLDSAEGCIGHGVMSRIRRGPWWTIPFLQFGRLRNILIPDVGTDIPFSIENFPYRDPLGRETVTFVREYVIGKRRSRFDATMIRVGDRIVDYLGSHQHLAVDLELTVDESGGLILTSHEQRFYEGPIGFRFPMLFSGRARLHEWYDEASDCFQIDLEVHNHQFGFLFGYRGSFECEWIPATDAPQRLKPVRHERRT